MSNTKSTPASPVILVTGATGTIGSQVAAQLLDAGATVRVAVRSPERASALAERGAQVVAFDWDDPATYEPAFAGAQRAFLASPFVEQFVPYIERAVEAAKTAGVEHLVRLSAIGADPTLEGVGRDHGEAEEVVKRSGLSWTVLQPTFFIDNAVSFQAPTLRSDGAFYGASKGGAVSYVASADVAAVAVRALLEVDEHQSKTYVLTGGEAISDEQLADVLTEIVGRPVAYVDVPPEPYAAGLRSSGTPEWMVEHLAFFENIKAQGWASGVSPAVEQVLGRAPTTPRDALARYQGKI